jgi:hypothetical protein
MNDSESVISRNSYKLFPTCTSTINTMHVSFDPRLALGIIQGNNDLKNLSEYSYEHRIRVLTSIDSILSNEVEHINVEQAAFYFSEKAKSNPELSVNLGMLSNQYSAHMISKTEKIKNKSKPMPSPSDNSLSPKKKEELENKQKHEIAHKNSLKNITPFKIPNPMK